MIVAAQEDPVFKQILNESSLAIPDGIGLKLTGKVKNKVAGIDLMEELLKISAKKGFKVGLLGGKSGVAEAAAKKIKKKYPGLELVYVKSGGEVDLEGRMTNVSSAITKRIDLLFVAFGHIKQEKWIAQNLSRIPVKVAMGVGGSLDYLAGTVLRPPKFIRSLGLEWLFRLIAQPWRIKRQINLFKFIWMVLFG